jgi:hypothetical protein
MKHPVKKILWIVMPIAVFLISSHVSAQGQSNDDQTTEAKRDVSVTAWDLAEIIPKAAKLSGELAILENKATNILDISEFEKSTPGSKRT